jgi:hypothetical protein
MEAVSPVTSDKKQAPDSLKYQWKLLGEVIRSDWATGLDKSVAFEVIENYYSKFGNSRASLRYLEKATGAARQNVIVSLRRLCENGPFSVARKGSGVRPTEYNLHFDRVAENASGHADVTARDDSPSGHADSTSGGHAGVTANAASGHADVTESVLPVPAYKADVLDRMIDPAAPTAPPLADGLAATATGVTAVEECANSQAEHIQAEPTFESLWRAYAHAKGKKEARAAWKALPPDTDLTAVIEAAAAWQASWAAQGKPDAPRYTLARWLADERYDEDAPTGYQPKAKASRPKPVTPSKAKPGRARTSARIASADVVKTGDVTELRISATDSDGELFEHVILLSHYDEDEQAEGQRLLRRLVDAAGLGEIEDSSELLGRTVVLTFDKDEFAAPTTRPDDDAPRKPKPEPVLYADTTHAPPAEPANYGTKEWEQRRAARLNAVAEWNAAHPEMFKDKDVRPLTEAEEAQRADYDAWYEASLEEDAA